MNNISNIDMLKIMIGAYYGIEEIDSYKTKEYVLIEIKKMINNFLEEHKDITNYNELDLEVSKLPSINKLQDSLILLNTMDVSFELVLLVKQKIQELKKGN